MEVKYGSQLSTLTLTVVEGHGPNLFGRDWLGKLLLDWKTIGICMLSEQSIQIKVLKKLSVIHRLRHNAPFLSLLKCKTRS